MAKANYKSALHHLNMLEGDVEARNLRIQQVKAAIPKSDVSARAEVQLLVTEYNKLDDRIDTIKKHLSDSITESETPED